MLFSKILFRYNNPKRTAAALQLTKKKYIREKVGDTTHLSTLFLIRLTLSSFSILAMRGKLSSSSIIAQEYSSDAGTL